MKLPNGNGRPVDAVPFFVVGSLAVLVGFSFGPLYLLALGVELRTGVPASVAVTAVAVAVAYRQLVWTVRPGYRERIDAKTRLRRLLLWIPIAIGVGILLALPFLPWL